MLLELLVGVIIVGAFFGQSVFGFGGGVVAVPLLGLILDIKSAISLALIFQFLIGLLIFANYRTIPWRRMPIIIGAMVFGTFLGLRLLLFVNAGALRIGLASYIICYLFTSLGHVNMRLTSDSPTGDFIAATLSGLLQGLIGTGGPNLVIHLRQAIPDRQVFRSALMLPFFMANLARILLSVPAGLLGHDMLSLAMPIVPFFLAAIYLGQKVQGKCSERFYNFSINTLLSLAAVGLIIKSL